MTADGRPLLVRNGFVYTADPDNHIYAGGAVLVVDGRIAAVGDDASVAAAVEGLEPAAAAELRTLDARGMMVLPGFVNAHWHEMFAMRIGFQGGPRDPDDRGDRPGFLSRGGDMHLISSIFDRFGGLIDRLTPGEAEAIATYSMWTQLRGGVTTLGDMGSLNRPAAMASSAGRLGIRAAVSTWAADVVCSPESGAPRRTRDVDEVVEELEAVFALCAGGDGMLRARPSAVYVTNMSDELGERLAELVDRHDTTFATHVGAQRHERDFVERYFGQTPIRRLDKLGLLSARLMAVHCAFVDDEEYELLAARNVHISHSPAKYGSSGESTLTETRMMSRYIRDGLPVSLSTDATATLLGGPLENMRAAWQTHNEIAADQTAVPPSTALAMATRVAAQGLGWPGIGSLEVGNHADLVLVRCDDWRYLLTTRPLETLLTLGGSADVDTVVVAGRTVLSGGRATVVDDAEVERNFLDALRAFTARLPGVDATRLDQLFSTRRN